MKVNEVIELVDRLKPNKFFDEDKYKWLSDIDGLIYREVILTHEDAPEEPFAGYEYPMDADRELLVGYPYDQLYRWYLESQIDLANLEIHKYNNSKSLFNNQYLGFTDWYNKQHMPAQKARFSFTERGYKHGISSGPLDR